MTSNRYSLIATTCAVLSSTIVYGQNNQNISKPNIIVFLADDAGMDFGCYGNSTIKTPNIDRLASQGLRFEKAFLTSPQSSPSRTSMMTGQFAHTIGTEDLHDPINDTTQMLPYYLNQAGYTTAFMLKSHWGINGDKQFSEIIHGEYLPNQGNLTSETYKNYNEFLDRNQDKPFFLWIGFIDPHRPYNREVCPQVNDPEKIDVPPFLINDSDTKRDLADYYDEISRMDSDIGIMMSELEKRGLTDNTIIIFLSDNGRPFPRCKGTLYDAGIQTPLIIVWDGHIRPNSVHTNGLISSIDLAPTILDIAGITSPNEYYGKSFKNILYNPEARGRDYIFAERNWHDTDEFIRCIRTENLKLIYNAYYTLPHGTPIDLATSPSWYSIKNAQHDGTLTESQNNILLSPRPMVEIYDLNDDPYELHNVADKSEYLEEGKKLAKLLNEWREETNDHNWWERRRDDQNDRITGFPLYETRPERYTE